MKYLPRKLELRAGNHVTPNLTAFEFQLKKQNLCSTALNYTCKQGLEHDNFGHLNLLTLHALRMRETAKYEFHLSVDVFKKNWLTIKSHLARCYVN